MGPLTVEYAIELVKKHGLLLLIALLFYADKQSMSDRLDIVEERLYDCYQDQLRTSSLSFSNYNERIDSRQVYAILPQDPVGKIKRS